MIGVSYLFVCRWSKQITAKLSRYKHCMTTKWLLSLHLNSLKCHANISVSTTATDLVNVQPLGTKVRVALKKLHLHSVGYLVVLLVSRSTLVPLSPVQCCKSSSDFNLEIGSLLS